MPRISFLVPTFNRAGFLGEALHAIIAQMADEDELLVIDDGSTDSTAQVVAAAGSRARYIRQNNAGKSAALNRGLAETHGAWVWICDDDDLLHQQAVSSLFPSAENSGREVVFGRYMRATREGERWLRTVGGYWPDLSSGSLVRHVLEDHFVMQNASLVTRSAYRAIGGFSDCLPRSVDYDASLRLAVSYEMKFVDKFIYEQREHRGLRGPKAFRIHPLKSAETWRAFDKAIFENAYRHLPITFFEMLFEGPFAEYCQRAAILQRAVVMARHDCWELACDDLEQAAQVHVGPLDSGEQQICARALCGKHGIGRLSDPLISQRLRSLMRKTPSGREMVSAILAGGIWRLRSKDLEQARSMKTAFLSIAGAGAVRIIMGYKLGKRRSSMVRECDDLPHKAYVPPGTIPHIAAITEDAGAAGSL